MSTKITSESDVVWRHSHCKRECRIYSRAWLLIPWNFAYKRRAGGLFLQRFWYAKFRRFFWVVTTAVRQKKNLRNFAYETLTNLLRAICTEIVHEPWFWIRDTVLDNVRVQYDVLVLLLTEHSCCCWHKWQGTSTGERRLPRTCTWQLEQGKPNMGGCLEQSHQCRYSITSANVVWEHHLSRWSFCPVYASLDQAHCRVGYGPPSLLLHLFDVPFCGGTSARCRTYFSIQHGLQLAV